MMDAPKCKVCGARHWGVCHQPIRDVRAAIDKVPAKKPAKKAKPKGKK